MNNKNKNKKRLLLFVVIEKIKIKIHYILIMHLILMGIINLYYNELTDTLVDLMNEILNHELILTEYQSTKKENMFITAENLLEIIILCIIFELFFMIHFHKNNRKPIIIIVTFVIINDQNIIDATEYLLNTNINFQIDKSIITSQKTILIKCIIAIHRLIEILIIIMYNNLLIKIKEYDASIILINIITSCLAAYYKINYINEILATIYLYQILHQNLFYDKIKK